MKGALRHAARLAALATALGALPASASAATITVNNTGDAAANDGACVLREAIASANANAPSGAMAGECPAGQAAPTVDTIGFNIAGAGPHVISPATPLPAVTQVATINGDTDVLPPGPPLDEIRIDGAATAGVPGIDVAADEVNVTGLSVTRFTIGVDLSGTDGAQVLDSFIGTDQAGTAGLGNLASGVRMGDPSAGTGTTQAEVSDNVIASNSSGVQITMPASRDNVVIGNRIGTTPAGTAALPNFYGVEIAGGADFNHVGGEDLDSLNLISGNTASGILLASNSPTANHADRTEGNSVVGNRIGTAANGESALANGADGITINAAVDDSIIRDNVISGNGNVGVRFAAEASQPLDSLGPSGNVIRSNLIGTDKDGVTAIGNDTGVALAGQPGHVAAGNVIGGTAGLTPDGDCTGECNLISGQSAPGIGISITPDTTGTLILGNYIGTDLTGEVALQNFAQGVDIGGGSATTVGSPAGPNRIAGNNSDAVRIMGSTGNFVQSNAIGIASDGDPLGNDGSGVLISGAAASDNRVGGTGGSDGNEIANNSTDGLRVEGGATDNPILANSVHDNASLGIDLVGATGVDANDVFDADTGSNDVQNYPFQVLAAADVSTSTTGVSGEIRTEASSDYRIEVFASPDQDPSGFGEGEIFLGGFEITTASDGKANFAEAVGLANPADRITMTATRLDGDGEPLSTSEFSAAVIEGCDNIPTSGDDVITGDVGADVLCGLDGDDSFVHTSGDDLIVGGAGDDEIDFSGTAVGYDVDLETGLAAGIGNLDLLGLVGVEDVLGSGFADVLDGDGGDNVLNGGAGTDDLAGKDGDDTVKGGDGKKDDATGGEGDDVVKGNDGKKDDLNGNDGKDKITGNGGSGDDCDGDGGNDRGGSGCEKEKSL